MILILAAMDQEVSAFLRYLDKTNEIMIDGIQVYEGVDFIVAKTGIGKVKAAYTCLSLIHHYKPNLIINIGSAGGLRKGQEVGDVVVCTQGSYHDFDLGEGPLLGNDNIFSGYVPHELLECLKNEGLPYHVGPMISGDQFLKKSHPNYAMIGENFSDAIGVDMECTAILEVSNLKAVPCIVIRSLSDVLESHEHEIQFDQYLDQASANSAKITFNTIKALKKANSSK